MDGTGPEQTNADGPNPSAIPRPVISFSFETKSRAKPAPKKDPVPTEVDYVDAIQENHLQSLNPVVPTGPLIIPLINQPPQHPAISSEDKEAAEALIKEARESTQPILVQNRIPGIEKIGNEEDRFRYDVSCRPEAREDAYERVSVAEFGTALLRGMGWAPGDPIGLTNKCVVKPIEYVPRPHRLGLGGSAKAPEPAKKKFIKPGESREPKPVMVLPKDADGRQRHVRHLDEKLVPFKPEGLHPGNLVAIVSGIHDGMYGRIQLVNESDEAQVKFANDEVVTVPKTDLMAVDSSQLPAAHPALSIPTSRDSKKRKKPSKSTSPSPPSASDTKSRSHRRDIWVRQHILVRIVSKSFQGGRYYRKKATVVDVISGDLCVLMLEDGKLLEGISQNSLESVLPEPGGTVLIVLGEGKGEKATLIEKSNSKGTAVVQRQDLSLFKCSADDISAFVG